MIHLLFFPSHQELTPLIGDGPCGEKPPLLPLVEGRESRQGLVLLYEDLPAQAGIQRLTHALAIREGQPGDVSVWTQGQREGLHEYFLRTAIYSPSLRATVHRTRVFASKPCAPPMDMCTLPVLAQIPTNLTRPQAGIHALAIAAETRGLGEWRLLRFAPAPPPEATCARTGCPRDLDKKDAWYSLDTRSHVCRPCALQINLGTPGRCVRVGPPRIERSSHG